MRKTAEFLMNFSHNHAIFHIWCTSVWAVCLYKLEENHLACFHVFVWSQNHHRHIFHGICSNKKSIYQKEGGKESSGRSRVSERKRENFSRCAHMSHTCSWDYLQCRNICILQFTESVRVWILTGAQNDHLSPRVCVFASLLVVVFFSLDKCETNWQVNPRGGWVGMYKSYDWTCSKQSTRFQNPPPSSPHIPMYIRFINESNQSYASGKKSIIANVFGLIDTKVSYSRSMPTISSWRCNTVNVAVAAIAIAALSSPFCARPFFYPYCLSVCSTWIARCFLNSIYRHGVSAALSIAPSFRVTCDASTLPPKAVLLRDTEWTTTKTPRVGEREIRRELRIVCEIHIKIEFTWTILMLMDVDNNFWFDCHCHSGCDDPTFSMQSVFITSKVNKSPGGRINGCWAAVFINHIRWQ